MEEMLRAMELGYTVSLADLLEAAGVDPEELDGDE